MGRLGRCVSAPIARTIAWPKARVRIRPQPATCKSLDLALALDSEPNNRRRTSALAATRNERPGAGRTCPDRSVMLFLLLGHSTLGGSSTRTSPSRAPRRRPRCGPPRETATGRRRPSMRRGGVRHGDVGQCLDGLLRLDERMRQLRGVRRDSHSDCHGAVSGHYAIRRGPDRRPDQDLGGNCTGELRDLDRPGEPEPEPQCLAEPEPSASPSPSPSASPSPSPSASPSPSPSASPSQGPSPQPRPKSSPSPSPSPSRSPSPSPSSRSAQVLAHAYALDSPGI